MTSKSFENLTWTVEQKARFLTEASHLGPEQLRVYLEREGINAGEFERWCVALQQDGSDSNATSKRIQKLERELARKEKALAETAALLVRATCRRRRRSTLS